MTRPQVSYNTNGDVIMSTEINGLIVSMRFKPDVADALASALNVMANHARRVQRKGERLDNLLKLNAEKPINFDAQQVKEKAAGQRVQTTTAGSANDTISPIDEIGFRDA